MTPRATAEPLFLDHRFTAMATPVTVRVYLPGPTAQARIRAAEGLFHDVDRSCTRFTDSSDLARVNQNPAEWHEVSPIFSAAVAAAELATLETSGRVDPRVLDHLEHLGYSVTFADVDLDGPAPRRARITAKVRAPFHAEHTPGRVRLDGHRIDLGGVAKGLAVDRALAMLDDAGSGALVEAGGDLAVRGDGPDGGRWNVDVEDPLARNLERDTLAVLSVGDCGVATSSIRHRHWRRGGEVVHHIIDPATGDSAASGLAAVTIVAKTAMAAERWSKALFVAGVTEIADEADARGIAALWVDESGAIGWSARLEPLMVWRSPDVPVA